MYHMDTFHPLSLFANTFPWLLFASVWLTLCLLFLCTNLTQCSDSCMVLWPQKDQNSHIFLPLFSEDVCTKPPSATYGQNLKGVKSGQCDQLTGVCSLGTQVEYECQSGFIQVGGNSTIECESSGTWSDLGLQCVSEFLFQFLVTGTVLSLVAQYFTFSVR